MKQAIYEVRIRPQRVAVLVNRAGTTDDFHLAVTFLSRLWGGRFCQILPVTAEGDEWTFHHLAGSRPDFVYAVGTDPATLADGIRMACQPRGIIPLTGDDIDKLKFSVAEHITAAHVLRHIRDVPVSPYHRARTLRLVGAAPGTWRMPFAATLYGVHYEGLTTATIAHQSEWLDESETPAEFVRRHARFAEGFDSSWLDVASFGLTALIHGQMSTPPTIVIVENEIADLSLFWNLRSASDSDMPNWVIPIPASAIEDADLIAALREWLLAFSRYLSRPNFCNVVSMSTQDQILRVFASRLREECRGTSIAHVDVVPPDQHLPLVIGHERIEQLVVHKSGRRVTFHPPRPAILPDRTSPAWIIDFIRDVRTQRAVEELDLPQRMSTATVLSCPGPGSSIPIARFNRLAIGPDSFNLRVSSSKISHFCAPSAWEIISECLREAGIRPRRDDKCFAYLPVVKMFGGLHSASAALRGKRAELLERLKSGPMSPDQLKGELRLGSGKLSELEAPKSYEQTLKMFDEATRRVFRRRLQSDRRRRSPASTDLHSLLEFWADRGILERNWRLGPCERCGRSFEERHLDISRSIRCPGCGARLFLTKALPMVYSLHRAVTHSMEQGLRPVVLTAQFLKSLSRYGFLWLPGMNFGWKEVNGDIDLLAICDGHLVFAECKTLSETPSDAGSLAGIHDQFLETIKVAEQCKAGVVALGSMCMEYPEEFVAAITKAVPPGMGLLLLTKADLERGYRKKLMNDGKSSLFWSIGDVIPQIAGDDVPASDGQPREIVTPYFRMTYRGASRETKGGQTDDKQ